MMDKFKNYTQWISIIIIALISVALRVIEYDAEGGITIASFADWGLIAWVMFGLGILLPPVLSIMMVGACTDIGMKPDASLQPLIDEYEALTKYGDTSKDPISPEAYKRNAKLKKGSKSFVSVTIGSIFSAQAFISIGTDPTAIVSSVIQLLMIGLTGLIAYNGAVQYVSSDLKRWYIAEIAQIKEKQKNADVISKRNGDNLQTVKDSVRNEKEPVLQEQCNNGLHGLQNKDNCGGTRDRQDLHNLESHTEKQQKVSKENIISSPETVRDANSITEQRSETNTTKTSTEASEKSIG